MKGPMRDLLPVGEQEVKVRLPVGCALAKFGCSRPNKTIRGHFKPPQLTVTVPSLWTMKLSRLVFELRPPEIVA